MTLKRGELSQNVINKRIRHVEKHLQTLLSQKIQNIIMIIKSAMDGSVARFLEK